MKNMEIDPKKMNFDKMKSGKNSNGEIRTDQAKKIDSVNNGAKYNPAPSFTPPANPASVSNSSQPMASLKKPTELLSEAWEMYKARWKTLLGIVIVPILLTIFVGIIFFIGLWGSGIMGKASSASFPDSTITFSIFSVLIFIFFVLIFIIQIWSQVALVYAIKESEDIGIKKAYQESKSKIKQFFWVSMLVGFITMGGFIFFAIPGFIFAVWFSFATFIVITEDMKGMDAILKSREYVRNYWWPVLWRFLFLYLVMIGIMVVASIALILIPILGNLASVAITPLIMIYMFLIYKNLKEIKGDFEFRPSAKAKKSFVAVGVLGILVIPLLFSSIVLVSLNSARDKAMDAARYANLSSIEVSLSIYYDDEKEYPKSLNELNIDYVDPETKEPYEYRQLDNGDDYELCALLDESRQCFSSENNVSNFSYDKPIRDTGEEDEDEKEAFEDTIKNRDKQRIFDLNSVSKMLKRYKEENGIYPVSYTSVKLDENNQVTGKIRSANEDKDIPVDPKDSEYYYSYQSVDGESFELTARLENLDDHSCDFEIKRSSGICIYRLWY